VAFLREEFEIALQRARVRKAIKQILKDYSFELKRCILISIISDYIVDEACPEAMYPTKIAHVAALLEAAPDGVPLASLAKAVYGGAGSRERVRTSQLLAILRRRNRARPLARARWGVDHPAPPASTVYDDRTHP